MAVLEVRMSEETRQKFAFWLTLINILGVLFALCLIGIGVYIKVAIEDKINLTDNYNNDILPWMMITIGIINVVVCGGGAFLSAQSRDVEKRIRQKPMYLPFVCVSIFAAICVFASAMMSFAHVGHLHHSFGNGLTEAMKLYKTDADVKEDIDVLQMEYECCGAYDFTDWFKTSWISNEFLDLDSKKVQDRLVHGEYYNDDAPFSCCDPSVMRPCIHHHVTKNSAHYLYDHEDSTTLYKIGCRQALMDYFSEILYESSIVIIAIFCVQILITLAMRYHQTSMGEAIDQGDPEADAPGYLFGSLAGQGHTPLSPAGGDFSSGSSNALFETPMKRSVSGGSRRGSRVRSGLSLTEYDALQARSSHRRYDTTDQTE